VRALVLANTTSGYPDAARAVWEQRIATVQAQGIEAIADAVMARYFHDGYRAEKAGDRGALPPPPGDDRCGRLHRLLRAVGKVDTTARLGRSRRRRW
jgi:3-oxoadipate enol-lactonase